MKLNRLVKELAVSGAILLATHSTAGTTETNAPAAAMNVLRGPAAAELRNVATLPIPPGYWFTDAAGARALLQKMGNLATGREIGLLAPTSGVWCVVFEFADIGYVKDTDRNQLSLDAMLAAIEASNSRANQQRGDNGWPALNILGWDEEPVYDSEANTFEWAIRAESKGETVINHNVRLLGRSGVIEATLLDQQHLSSTLTALRHLIAGIAFKPGEQYADYQSGDKLAKGGLATLVTSGETASVARFRHARAPDWQSKVWWLGWFFCVIAVILIFVAKSKTHTIKRRAPGLPCAVFHVVAYANPAPTDATIETAGDTLASAETNPDKLKKRRFRFDIYYFNLLRQLS